MAIKRNKTVYANKCKINFLYFQVVVNRYKRTISEVTQAPPSPTIPFSDEDVDDDDDDDSFEIPHSK